MPVRRRFQGRCGREARGPRQERLMAIIRMEPPFFSLHQGEPRLASSRNRRRKPLTHETHEKESDHPDVRGRGMAIWRGIDMVRRV